MTRIRKFYPAGGRAASYVRAQNPGWLAYTLSMFLLVLAGILGYQWRGPLGLSGCMLTLWAAMWLLGAPRAIAP